MKNPIQTQKRTLIIAAWTMILLISDLPDVMFNAFSSQIPGWLSWGKVAVLGIFLGLTFAWKRIRPLRQFAVVFLVFYLALEASKWIGGLAGWQAIFMGDDMTFAGAYAGVFIRDIGVALAVIAVLWIIKHRREAFFMVKGQLDAPIEPVRWLGIKEGESWRVFGWIVAGIAGLGVLIPTSLSLDLSGSILVKAAPLIPAVLIFSAINAFTEETYFRTTVLSTLPEHTGKTHALLINAVFFGMAHVLYGDPSGLAGFLMTGFLAWLLGKSMLETKGFLWAWFIHFVVDLFIFASYAYYWVQG